MMLRCFSTHASLSAIVMDAKLSPVSGSVCRVSVMVRQSSDAQQQAAVKDMSVMPASSLGYSAMPGYRAESLTFMGRFALKLLSSKLTYPSQLAGEGRGGKGRDSQTRGA